MASKRTFQDEEIVSSDVNFIKEMKQQKAKRESCINLNCP